MNSPAAQAPWLKGLIPSGSYSGHEQRSRPDLCGHVYRINDRGAVCSLVDLERLDGPWWGHLLPPVD